MATLVFTAIGTSLGGPLGGAVGGLIGQQVDASLFGGRQGPRLNDLKVTTSAYGSAIAHHLGTVRAPGTIIWSTELVEHSDTQGGGKGGSATTTYSYSVSFAVALASQPITEVRRIWADGNLLRGAEGDLKVGGDMRFYSGHGDHGADPLIAAAEGALAPAFRGTAYVVFEDLDLSTFGNRIPALSFELVANSGAISLASMLYKSAALVESDLLLAPLAGFSYDGGPIAAALSTIDSVYPLAMDAGGEMLTLRSGDAVPPAPAVLPEPAVADDEQSFGQTDGRHSKRHSGAQNIPTALRYYDIARDYLTGMQRADGRARQGRERTIDFPGSLSAQDARALANACAQRASFAQETMAWRMAELDPQIGPGSVVRVPNETGNWRVTSWEWRDTGVELELLRLPRGPARSPESDSGLARTAADRPIGATLLNAFELPWSGVGSGSVREIFVAASSSASGWRGASLFLADSGQLLPVGLARQRAVVGTTATSLGSSPSLVLERQAKVEVVLAAEDFALVSAPAEALAKGANRALVGGELIQFANATALGAGRWRLTGLLRGRGGTEAAGKAGHAIGTAFMLLDGSITALDPTRIPSGAVQLAAAGLVDAAPVYTDLVNTGSTLKPLTPVHPAVTQTSGGIGLRWTRRARGAWIWRDEVDAPLVEGSEAYLVGLGPVEAPSVTWLTQEPALFFATATYNGLAAAHPGHPLWVRQSGTYAMSDPLLLHILP